MAADLLSGHGDYGTGKTSFSRYFAARQTRRYLADPETQRVPLLIPLHRYTKAPSARTMLLEFLSIECEISNLKPTLFFELVAEGTSS